MSPSITDWIMVGVTIAYVVATIFIFRANKKSAEAAVKQLNESQEQFEESSRLACLPYLQVELARSDKADFEIVLPPSIEGDREISRLPIESPKVIIKNVGNGSAINMIFSFSYNSSENNETDILPISAIMKGDKYCFLCIFPQVISEAVLELQYDDFIGNQYEQKIYLHFDNNHLVSCENDMPRLVG